MNMLSIVVITIIILVILFGIMTRTEGYSSLINEQNDYYLWRPYAHNVYDEERMTRYPYDYKPYEYDQCF